MIEFSTLPFFFFSRNFLTNSVNPSIILYNVIMLANGKEFFLREVVLKIKTCLHLLTPFWLQDILNIICYRGTPKVWNGCKIVPYFIQLYFHYFSLISESYIWDWMQQKKGWISIGVISPKQSSRMHGLNKITRQKGLQVCVVHRNVISLLESYLLDSIKSWLHDFIIYFEQSCGPGSTRLLKYSCISINLAWGKSSAFLKLAGWIEITTGN